MDASLKINRRDFIKKSAIVTTAATVLNSADLHARTFDNHKVLTILHTNDVHSRIEPFPMDGSKYQGLGGVASRSALITKIRSEQRNVLLLDAGDIFQGTPYFNKFGGEVELKMMSSMKYDASTMGNHDFDNGLQGFYQQLPNANFPIICSNYDFSNTILNKSTIPYKIFKLDGLKIGVFGVGIALKGLVADMNYGETIYKDPIFVANDLSDRLSNDYKCDLVICLSHLGYKYASSKVSDQVLAKNNKNIDLIIGGHTHTFMNEPEDVINLSGKVTTINQVGFAGINLGRIDYHFENYKGKKILTSSPYVITNELSS